MRRARRLGRGASRDSCRRPTRGCARAAYDSPERHESSLRKQSRLCAAAHDRRSGGGDQTPDRRLGPMQQQDERARLSAAYRRFAADEARGRSPLYEELARGVAADSEILDFLLALPRPKRQPNLLFAAARSLLGTPDGWNRFRRGVMQRKDALHALMLMRSTQTNEPGRCAALLPVLTRLPQPLALLEVGASAGLCLLPDFYAYDYCGRILAPDTKGSPPPVFPCKVNSATPIPAALPRVVWRAGLDLEPVDLSDPGEVAWLEALVWPEQIDRLARLRAAIAIACEQRPRVVKGDLRTDLPA